MKTGQYTAEQIIKILDQAQKGEKPLPPSARATSPPAAPLIVPPSIHNPAARIKMRKPWSQTDLALTNEETVMYCRTCVQLQGTITMAGEHISPEWARQVNGRAAWSMTWKGELT